MDTPYIALNRGTPPAIGPAISETVRPQALTVPDDARPKPQSPPAFAVPGYDGLELLGSGSMGIVYKARQTGLGRSVAIKMLPAGHRGGRELLQRLTTEARALASLQHPNIIQIYEINLEHEPPYFSMELVEGGTLADRLDGQPQPVRLAAHLVQTLARAVHAAHMKGIIHRDLKPGNILLPSANGLTSTVQRLTRELGLPLLEAGLGTPKISDFGLAKDLHANGGLTESGVIMGTPHYMAPEQAEGKSREVGPAADIYALGAILYEMLTGRPPFTAESQMETFLLLFHAEPVPPSQLRPKVPRDLETICLKCLHKVPHRRYATAEDLADDLRRFLAGEPILARPPSRSEKLARWARRRPAMAVAAACGLVAVAGLLGLGAWHQAELQTQLGQAIQAERDSRDAEAVTASRERLAQLRGKAADLVHAAEKALAASDWAGARVHLARARGQLADAPELADLRAQVDVIQRRADRQRLDHERLDRFLDRRNAALFHATLFTGSGLVSDVADARAAAIEALAQFGVTPGAAGGPDVNSPFYTAHQKAQIVEGCYELIVTLADAAAQPLPGQPVADQRCRAGEAVRLLDRAAGLGGNTQAYHRRRARYLAAAGQPEAAALERRLAAGQPPATPMDHFLCGQERFLEGDFGQAVAAFESALQLRPDHFWANYYLALSWLKAKRPDQAVTCLTACLAQRREFPWLYLLRAAAWCEVGQYARAEVDFESARRGDLPGSARYGLLINRGVMRIRQGRLDSAEEDLRAAVALRPGQYHGYLNLAQAYLSGGRSADALRELDQAVRLEPGLADLYRTRAHVRLLRHETGPALGDLDEAIRLEPNSASPAAANDHLDRARILCEAAEFAKALAAADAAKAARPGDARAYRLRAEALVGLGRPPEALGALDECLKLKPADLGAVRARAALRTQLGQYPGAQADYTRALELAPDAPTYAARGWCYLVAGAPRLALPDFEEAIRRDPDLGDAYAGRGCGRAVLGQHLLAVADAEEALKRGPESPRLCYNVARIYAQAVARVDRVAGYVGMSPTSPRHDWEARAVRALTRSLELQPPADAVKFWQTVVGADKAFDAIRGGRGYARLAATFPAPPPGKARVD